LTVVLANGLLVFITYWPLQYRWSHTYAQQLVDIAHASESTRVKVYFSNFYATQLRFGARGIRYEAVPIPPTCSAPIALIHSEVIVCP
jgi:hypothetical protein